MVWTFWWVEVLFSMSTPSPVPNHLTFCREYRPQCNKIIWKETTAQHSRSVNNGAAFCLPMSTEGRHSVYRCQQRDGILSTDVNRGTAFCLPMSTEGRHSVYRCQQRDGILSTDVNRGTAFCLPMIMPIGIFHGQGSYTVIWRYADLEVFWDLVDHGSRSSLI